MSDNYNLIIKRFDDVMRIVKPKNASDLISWVFETDIGNSLSEEEKKQLAVEYNKLYYEKILSNLPD